MPEHVHLLVSEPRKKKLSSALQMLKDLVSRELPHPTDSAPFWQPRYYEQFPPVADGRGRNGRDRVALDVQEARGNGHSAEVLETAVRGSVSGRGTGRSVLPRPFANRGRTGRGTRLRLRL